MPKIFETTLFIVTCDIKFKARPVFEEGFVVFDKMLRI